jgi:maltose alpha-D-glucosyltransferase/alpha-amylase
MIYYGDEIGMGDNVYLGDRNGVRTPMQWRPDRNAGFSDVDPQRLYLPAIMDPVYGYQAVNVEAQARETSSLLNWMRRMLATRKAHRAFGRGTLVFLRPHNRKILAYLREYEDDVVLCVANLARAAQPVALDLARHKGRVPVELLGRARFPPIGEQPYLLTLPGHGFMWFQLATGEAAPAGIEERPAPEELPVLVLFDGWASLFRDRVVPWRIALAEKVREQLEREVLPAFIGAQRWYAAKGEPIKRVALIDHAEWDKDGASWLITFARPERDAGEPQTYWLPLALAWDDDDERARALQGTLLARVRQQARVGGIADAFADEAFCRALVVAIGEGSELRFEHGTARFHRTTGFNDLAGQDYAGLPVRPMGAQSSNTVIALGDRLLLKAYRRPQPGVNPELEVARFLTEVARFDHSVPIAGAIDYVASDGATTTLALLQEFVANQGDAWGYTLNYVEQFLEQYRSGTAAAGAPGDVHGGYLALMRTLGRRTAELHAAFATSSGDPAFDPEPVEARDLAAWAARAVDVATSALDRLEQRRDALNSGQSDGVRLLARRAEILEYIERLLPAKPRGSKTRLHGDYHLGQVLLAQNDFVITDFEGEPTRPLAERRQKGSVLRDVAGMLRSFNYARHQALAHAIAERPDALASLAEPAVLWEAPRAAPRRVPRRREAADRRARGGRAQPIELFTLEKAFHELAYEVDHRPCSFHCRHSRPAPRLWRSTPSVVVTMRAAARSSPRRA